MHTLGTFGEKRGEHLLELVADGELAALERHLGVLDVSNAGRGAWDESVAQCLCLGEGPEEKLCQLGVDHLLTC